MRVLTDQLCIRARSPPPSIVVVKWWWLWDVRTTVWMNVERWWLCADKSELMSGPHRAVAQQQRAWHERLELAVSATDAAAHGDDADVEGRLSSCTAVYTDWRPRRSSLTLNERRVLSLRLGCEPTPTSHRHSRLQTVDVARNLYHRLVSLIAFSNNYVVQLPFGLLRY